MKASTEPSTPNEESVISPGDSEVRGATADQMSPAAVDAPPKRVPDFFIVGHQKCGTTALYLMLRSHPQIFMPDVKEPRYFASDLRSRFPVRSPEARRLHTLDGYLSLFTAARPDQLIGEASPQYLRSRAAPGGIAEMQPDARIVVILREPASFLRSFHLQMVSSNIETQRDFRKAIGLEEARRQGKHVPRRTPVLDALQYSGHVRYVEQLRRFHAVFPAENVLVLIYDDFRRDNEATVRTVLRFLGVDDTCAIETLDTKPLKSVRSLPLHQLASAARVARTNPVAAGPLARTVNALTPGPMRSDAFRALWRRVVYGAPRPPDEQFMLELRRRFKGEVVALSEYLDRDLVSLWGYDKIG
jgi:Sulfotransferase family